MTIRSFIRANYKIRVPRVRCVDQQGNMIGVLDTREAIRIAQQAGMDLVEISPNADPPVCKIMDFGKYKYQESQKEKEARKHQHAMVVKEAKFHATIAEHDFQTKVNHIRVFLEKGFRVKIILTLRGRENAHKEVGFDVINRVIKETQGMGTIEMVPRMIGHSIVAVLVGKRHEQPRQQSEKRPDERQMKAVVDNNQSSPSGLENCGKSLDGKINVS